MVEPDFRSLGVGALEAIRRQAVAAVRSGMSQVDAAKVFGTTRQAVGNWIEIYADRGRAVLKAKRRGRPPNEQLNSWRAARVSCDAINRCPDQLRLPYYLWTREAAGQLIKERFGIRLSLWTVGRYLARWGFTSQKPVRRVFEQDSVQVKKWLGAQYPQIRASAKLFWAEIYRGDEMVVRSDHAAGRTFSKRGKTPVVAVTGRRFGCIMISAIANRGRRYFMVLKSRFVSSVFVQFIRRLCKQIPHQIYLIVDSHPMHRSAALREEVKGYAGKLRLFFFQNIARS